MLALSFLLLIGMSLVAEGLDQHIPKGYIYFAMGFSVFVEMLNLRMFKKKGKEKPIHLRQPYVAEVAPQSLPTSGPTSGTPAPPRPKKRR